MEIWPLVIPSLLTIAGWFIGAYYAVKQVNHAHEKNRELQAALLKQSKKDRLASDFIDIYLEIARAINAFTKSLYDIGLNMALDESHIRPGMVFGWRNKIDEVNKCYSELGTQMGHLSIWLDVHGGHIPNASTISLIVEKYSTYFTAKHTVNDQHAWVLFQSMLARIQADDNPNSNLYYQRASTIGKNLTEIYDGLREEAKIVEKHLLAPDSIAL